MVNLLALVWLELARLVLGLLGFVVCFAFFYFALHACVAWLALLCLLDLTLLAWFT